MPWATRSDQSRVAWWVSSSTWAGVWTQGVISAVFIGASALPFKNGVRFTLSTK